MLKKQFLDELRKRLSKKLKTEEVDDIIEEFSLHIDMEIANGKSEEEIIDTFGDVNELVKELLEAYDMDESVGDKVESIVKAIVETGEDVFEKVVDFTKETVENVQKTTNERQKEFQERQERREKESANNPKEERKVVIERDISPVNFGKGYKIIGLVFLFNVVFSIILGIGGVINPFNFLFLNRFGWWINQTVYGLAGSALLVIVLLHVAFLIFGTAKDVKIVEVKPKDEKNNEEVKTESKRVEVKKKRVVREEKKTGNNVLKIILLIILIPILLPVGVGVAATLLSLLIASFVAIIPTVLAFGLVIAFALQSGLLIGWFVAIILLGVLIIELAFLNLSIGFFKWLFEPKKKKKVIEEVIVGGDSDEI